MGYTKLTGSKAILGGAVILTSPTIYSNLSTSTSSFKIYGVPYVYTSTTDTATGRVQVGGTGTTSSLKGGISFGGVTRYIKKIPFTSAKWTTSVTTSFNTGWAIPSSATVHDVWFHITTVGSSIALKAGTTGTSTGFIKTAASTPAGTKRATVDNAGVTYGSHFMVYTWSTCDVAGVKEPYVPGAAKNVSIGRSATNLAMPAGSLFIEYTVPGY